MILALNGNWYMETLVHGTFKPSTTQNKPNKKPFRVFDGTFFFFFCESIKTQLQKDKGLMFQVKMHHSSSVKKTFTIKSVIVLAFLIAIICSSSFGLYFKMIQSGTLRTFKEPNLEDFKETKNLNYTKYLLKNPFSSPSRI